MLQTGLVAAYSVKQEYYRHRWVMQTLVLWTDENSYLKHYT